MKVVENQIFERERALYGSRDVLVRNGSFDGPADGESVRLAASKIHDPAGFRCRRLEK